MNIQSAWVNPPQAVPGQDPLGTHAPCIAMYSRLLPGITNVTDRARYYSLYSWFVWSFDHRYPKADHEKFRELIRRADVLLTLISERHARQCNEDSDQHGIAMIGRQTLVPALTDWENGNRLPLSAYSEHTDSGRRYFMNKDGGLGQYYLGPLQELGILERGSDNWIRYTKPRGERIAIATDAGVDADQFFAALEGDLLSLSALDSLSFFCFCKLKTALAERDALLDILFDRKAEFSEVGEQRRASLGLVLDLVRFNASHLPHSIGLDDFRTAIYSASALNRSVWTPQAPLTDTYRAWNLYQRNEIFSLAVQTIFAVALAELRDSSHVFSSPTAVAGWFTNTKLVRDTVRQLKAPTVSDAVAFIAKHLPALSDFNDASHEVTLYQTLVENSRDIHDAETRSTLLKAASDLLLSLVARANSTDAYAANPFDKQFLNEYPVNLQALHDESTTTWVKLTPSEWLGWLLEHWGINNHFQIALRKLRSSPKSTFRIRPTDRGLEVQGDATIATRTNPRIGQALQILRDLGAIEDSLNEPHSKLTDLGSKLLDEALHA